MGYVIRFNAFSIILQRSSLNDSNFFHKNVHFPKKRIWWKHCAHIVASRKIQEMSSSYQHQGRVVNLSVVELNRNRNQSTSDGDQNERHSVLATSKVCGPTDPMILDFLDGHRISEPGHCAIYESTEMNQKWFVLTDQETHCTYIMVTKMEDYPYYVATRCIEELSSAFHMYQRSKKKPHSKFLFGKIRRVGKRKSKKLQKEIDSLVLKYDNLDGVSKIWKSKKAVEDLTKKMEENIRSVLQNTEDADILLEKSQELVQQTKVFKKRTKKIKEETLEMQNGLWGRWAPFDSDGVKRYARYATVGAYVGGAAACFVCPPAGATILSGAGCAAVYGLISSSTESGVEFWSHKFVAIKGLDVYRFQALWTCRL